MVAKAKNAANLIKENQLKMKQEFENSILHKDQVRCSVLQCVAVCCSLLQSVAVCCCLLQPVAVCCSVRGIQIREQHSLKRSGSNIMMSDIVE